MYKSKITLVSFVKYWFFIFVVALIFWLLAQIIINLFGEFSWTGVFSKIDMVILQSVMLSTMFALFFARSSQFTISPLNKIDIDAVVRYFEQRDVQVVAVSELTIEMSTRNFFGKITGCNRFSIKQNPYSNILVITMPVQFNNQHLVSVDFNNSSIFEKK